MPRAKKKTESLSVVKRLIAGIDNGWDVYCVAVDLEQCTASSSKARQILDRALIGPTQSSEYAMFSQIRHDPTGLARGPTM